MPHISNKVIDSIFPNHVQPSTEVSAKLVGPSPSCVMSMFALFSLTIPPQVVDPETVCKIVDRIKNWIIVLELHMK